MQDHPVVLVPYLIELDILIAPLIQECWRLGWATRYCCQGEPAGPGPASAVDQAYIAFRGPYAPSFREVVSSVYPEWPHRLEDDEVIRFPQGWIEPITQALVKLRTGD